MIRHLVSPRFEHTKLEPPFYRDVVDVFEDRMRGWLIAPAMTLLATNEYSIASVALATSYFEGIEIYHRGQDSIRKSREFFKQGFRRVFTLAGESEAVQNAVIDSLYDLLRCGFAHDAMFRSGINFSTVRQEPIFVTLRRKDGRFDPTAPVESVIIHPREFVESIERHFTTYVAALRKATDEVLKSNFERAIAIKWTLGQPGRVIGMSEEAFMRGDRPREA